jgi:glycosyltransferase involved in cell wall biosynthesis
MNVLIASPSFGTFGGLEAFIFTLADELVDHGIDVTLALKRVAGDFDLAPSLQSHVDGTPATVHFVDRASGDLAALIDAADVVHGQNTSIDVALLARRAGTPLVLTIHGWRRQKWTPRGLLNLWAHRLADRVWYNSDFVWESWEPGRKRPTSGKLPVVSDLPTGTVPVADRSGFVFAARWIENKGLRVLLRAYAGADLDRGEWPLVLLGDGPLRPEIDRMIQSQNIDGVDIRGFVDTATRNDLIRHARWMVTPPHTQEDLGLTPIEARNVAVPAIITRDGGLPEAGGRHALICEPDDVRGLRALLERAARMPEDEYRRIACATHAELQDYLQPMSVYIDEYQDLLASRHTTSPSPRSRPLDKA